MHKPARTISCLIIGICFATASPLRSIEEIPRQLTDTAFWKMIEGFSARIGNTTAQISSWFTTLSPIAGFIREFKAGNVNSQSDVFDLSK